MVKASQTIGYKNADAPYLEAEWIGSYSEAVTGQPSSGVPNFIGRPGYIIPKTVESELLDNYFAYFKVTTNVPYKIISSVETIKEYRPPIPNYINKTPFLHSETIVFVDEQFKKLSKIPDDVNDYRWSGTPSIYDLQISIKGQEIKLSQKARGALLIIYSITSDVWYVPTHSVIKGFAMPESIIMGIFAEDDSGLSTSLQIDTGK